MRWDVEILFSRGRWPEEKKSFGRPNQKEEDNIIMDLKGIWYEGVYWILVAGCCC